MCSEYGQTLYYLSYIGELTPNLIGTPQKFQIVFFYTPKFGHKNCQAIRLLSG